MPGCCLRPDRGLVEVVMSDIRRQDEPSMEEILASIRRIIAEDAEAGGKTGDIAAEQDILELTDKVEPDGSIVSLAPRPAPRSEPPEPPPIAAAPPEPVTKPEPQPVAADVPKPAVAPAESVMSPAAAAASVAALSALAREAPRAVPAAEPAAGGRALEETPRELLKPLLKAWLDANLPPLIERIVREEIARLGRAARGG